MGVSEEPLSVACANLTMELGKCRGEIARLTRECDEARRVLDALTSDERIAPWLKEQIKIAIECEEARQYRQALEEIANLSDDRDKSVWFSEAVDIARRAISTGEG